MIQLAATSSPVEVAWAAFDAAAIRLNAIYADASTDWDSPAEHRERFELAMETVRLWKAFSDLFLADETPGSAA